MKHETQQSASLWADSVFGFSVSNFSTAARANQEMAELLKALAIHDKNSNAGEEIADIIIILWRLANDLNVNVQELIDQKMAKNRARKWQCDGSGHGYHVKENNNG